MVFKDNVFPPGALSSFACLLEKSSKIQLKKKIIKADLSSTV